MAWNAEVLKVTKNEGNVVATVRFAETVTGETFSRDVPAQDLSPDSLAAYCQRVIVGLEARDQAAKTIAVGPVTLPRDASDQATKDKIAADAAADAFFVLLADYNALQAQVAKKIIAPDAKAVSDAANAMKAAFLPEYASDPRFR